MNTTTLASQARIHGPTKARMKEVARQEHVHLRQLALNHAVQISTAGLPLPHGIIESADRLYRFIATGKVLGLSAPTPKRRRKK